MNVFNCLLSSRHAFSNRVGGFGLFGLVRGQEQWGISVSYGVGTSGTKACLGDRSICSHGANGSSNTGRGVVNVDETGKKKRKKERIDSPYVLRRTVYLQKLQALRKQFMKRIEADRAEKKRIETERNRQSFINAQLRLQNARTRIEMRKQAHESHISEMKARRRERSEHGYKMWQDAQIRHEDKLKALALQLENASSDWISEDTLEDAITQVVDDFFIVSGRQTELAQR